LFAAEVDAEVEFAGEVVEGVGLGGFGCFALFDEFVGKLDGALICEFAFVFLGPGFGIGESIAKCGDVDGKAVVFCVVNGDVMAFEDFGAGPEFVEKVPLSIGCADDAEFFGSAAEAVADGGEDGFPDGFGISWKANSVRMRLAE
jgi:hypothetical protein